jgi:hypothetical protein
LPGLTAYNDAPNQRPINFKELYPFQTNAALIRQYIRSGYGIAVHIGRHITNMFKVSDDDWWFFGPDSELAGQNFGNGVGIRAHTAEELNTAYSLVVVQTVNVRPELPIIIQPPEPPLTTAAQIVTAIQTQTSAGALTLADANTILAAAQASVTALTGVNPPPPPSPPPPITPASGSTPLVVGAAPITDQYGIAWRLGNYGSMTTFQLYGNAMGVAKTTQANMVNGRLRAWDLDNKVWREWQGGPLNDKIWTWPVVQ